MPRQPYELFDNRQQKAALEARNGLLQFSAIEKMVDSSKNQGFVFTPEILRDLHRLVIQDIYTCAGQFRTYDVYIENALHQPPPFADVPQLVDDMCKYINDNFGRLSGLQLAAYAMWRVNWIHPFAGGNGRTSRGASYLLLNVRMGFNLPGVNTIAQQIENDRAPYYDALAAADEALRQGNTDVSAMEALMSQLLAAQLLSVHQKASNA